MTYYEIDFGELVKMLLPVRLRRAVTLAWLRCLVLPVTELYNRFVTHRNDNLYTLSHNSQVVYLQAALNDTFDPVLRRIYIVDTSVAEPLYTYLQAESHPQWLGLAAEAATTPYPCPQWLFTGAEYTTSGYAFIIMIPAAIVYDTPRLRALTDKYRLPSKGSYSVVGF